MPCDSCKDKRFEGIYRLHHEGEKNCVRSVLQLLVTANFLNTLILFIPMIVTTRSPETSVLTKAITRHIQEICILNSYRRENLKSCIALSGWAV
jgi:hypothetical protein